MNLVLTRIEYKNLKAKQQENYNYQKVSALLADFGFMTIRLSDDWAGADFIAQHIDGTVLKVQLKSRLIFDKKYLGKELWVAFPYKSEWYIYPHDPLLEIFLAKNRLGHTGSWKGSNAKYSFPQLSVKILEDLCPFRIVA